MAPNESYIIFTSHGWDKNKGRGDFFVSFSGTDGKWLKPVTLGDEVNSPVADMSPYVSPDGKYFFFCSMRKGEYNPVYIQTYVDIKRLADNPMNGRFDIYWISAGVIEKAREAAKTK